MYGNHTRFYAAPGEYYMKLRLIKIAPSVRLELTTAGLEVRCAIHCATRAKNYAGTIIKRFMEKSLQIWANSLVNTMATNRH